MCCLFKKKNEKSLDGKKKRQEAISNDGSFWIQKEKRLVTKYNSVRKDKNVDLHVYHRISICSEN